MLSGTARGRQQNLHVAARHQAACVGWQTSPQTVVHEQGQVLWRSCSQVEEDLKGAVHSVLEGLVAQAGLSHDPAQAQQSSR